MDLNKENFTMKHLPEIWDCINKNLTKGQWNALKGIYDLVGSHLCLDKEDFDSQSPSSNLPKWKRNVRNVLQYRRKTSEISWDSLIWDQVVLVDQSVSYL